MKVTDFGFAKYLPKGMRTTTMCGTPDYMAPEILKGDRYSFSVDWWALGVLIYEMLFGMPPFTDKDNKGTYSKILTGLIRFPRGTSALARGCMKRLLTHDPERRSGYIDWNQQSNLRQHPWFEDMSFKSLLSRRTQVCLCFVALRSPRGNRLRAPCRRRPSLTLTLKTMPRSLPLPAKATHFEGGRFRHCELQLEALLTFKCYAQLASSSSIEQPCCEKGR